MAEAKLDDIAKGAPPKEEKKPVGTLESVVDETIHGAKTLFNLGLAGLVPATQVALVPYVARDTAILAGAQVAGDATTSFKRGQKFTSKNTLESAVMGTALTVPTYHMFRLINKIPTNDTLGYITKGAAWGGIAYPLYIGMYQFIDYVIKNRKLKGAFKYIKENYWTALKTAWKRIFPISLFNIFLAPAYLQIPIAATLSYMLTLFGAPKKDEIKEEQKRDKTPYLAAATNVTGKLFKNTFKGLYDAVYAVGSGMSDLYKTAPKPAPAAKPA